MIKNHFKVLLIVISIMGMTSCGSSGGGGSPIERPAGTLAGFAVDAQIVGGTVTVYSFKNGQKGDVLGSAITDEKGFYSIDIQAPDQHLLIEIRGGSYIEEASGESITLKEAQVLRAVTFFQSGSPLSIMVTPFTNIAAGLVAYSVKQGRPIETAVTEAGSAISSMVGVDILKTVPANITDLNNASTQFSPELKYGFMAAAISSWTAEASRANGSDVHSIWNSIALAQIMYRDISEDGKLDGKGIDPDNQTSVDLGLGLVIIDANTYRAELAKHLMLMVGSDQNKTGITFRQAVPLAEGLASTTHPMFGSLAPIPFDEVGPVITPKEAEGLFHNAVFTFSVNVTDAVGIKTVNFDLDGVGIGEALDPENPSILINTALYADGSYKVGVAAKDHLNNNSYRQFDIKFANNGAEINVLSPTTVNASPVTLSGNYVENGPAIESILVEGVLANLDIENKTWTVQVPLVPPTPGQSAAFVTSLQAVAKNALGVETHSLISMTMDTIPPKFDPVPLYSNATFISGGLTFTDKLSFAEDSNIPVRIETDKISLNGTPILPGPLDQNNIPWVLLRAKDINANGVFTPENEITALFQYSLSGGVLTSWRPLLPVVTGDLHEYIIPLASETLHENWHLAAPGDIHLIEVKIKDRAGNTMDFTFRFKIEFVPPAPVITSKSINSFNKSFVERAMLHNATLLVSEHTFTNTTGRSILFSLSDSSAHQVTNVIEEAIKVFQGQLFALSEIQDWNYFTNTWEASHYAQQTASNQPNPPVLQTFPTVNLPPDVITSDWVINSLVIESGDRWRWRLRDLNRWQITLALDSLTEVIENRTFSTDRFEVVNIAGENKIAINGWYRISAGEAYTIKRFVRTAIMNVYNDTELLGPFTSSTPLRLDKTLSWEISNAFNIKLVHDIGFERVGEMVPLSVVEGIGSTTYTVSRAAIPQ